jgi:hypothetical protein
VASKHEKRVSENERDRSRKERAIFRKFARAVGSELSVDRQSIRSRRPPQPDIYCLSASHSAYRFELRELADNTMKQSCTNGDLTLEWLAREQCLDQSELEGLNLKYDRCYVDVCRPKKNVRTVLTAIARYLLHSNVQAPSVGAATLVLRVRDIPGTLLESGLVQIHAPMSSLKEPGSRWQVNSGGSFSDGVREAIADKADRTYSLRGIVVKPQLLLYYDKDPPYMTTFPCEFNVLSLRDTWRTKFTDIWVFDANESRVIIRATA